LIECQDVIKIFRDPETKARIAALRGIDLQINRGELISIIGPSGSGKSTLISLIAGLEPVSSGKIWVDSYEISKMDQDELLDYRLSTVGLVHQFPERTLILNASLKDNLLFASSLSSKNMSENKARNKEILTNLGIDHLERRLVNNLSGGEMIRAAIAFMLAKKAPLLLCDEPTGQLDSKNSMIVKDLLKKISKDYNTTILVVTHDKSFLEGVDRTCEIHSGRVSSMIAVDEHLSANKETFPLKYPSQIDSSQNVRIPNTIYNLLRLNKQVIFEVTEDSAVAIKHPKNLEPIKIKPQKEIKRKKLVINPLPSDYFTNQEVKILLRNTSKIYGSANVEVHALSDVDLDFFAGELAFIIGPSGSGKTTLVKLLTGMEPCSNGSINVFDFKLSTLSDKERAKFRRKMIGIVSQQGNLHPHLQVKENIFIKDIFSNKTIKSDDYQEQIEQNLEDFQIEHRINSYPLEISGGELQRASLAIAKYHSPEILIFDEPTANMDGELAEEVMEHLYSIHENSNNTMLITTHDTSIIRNGSRVIHLKDGTIDQDGLATMVEEKAGR
jgi:ABC-type lipoprotein export system ATPase subunit